MDQKATNIELKQISETEYLVGSDNAKLIHDNIVFVTAVGEQTTPLAELVKEISLKLGAKSTGQVYYLIDLNKCGKNSPEARQMWKELCLSDKTRKVALFGLHPVAKVLASFFIGITNAKKERFFSSKDEALNWLLEDKSKSK